MMWPQMHPVRARGQSCLVANGVVGPTLTTLMASASVGTPTATIENPFLSTAIATIIADTVLAGESLPASAVVTSVRVGLRLEVLCLSPEAIRIDGSRRGLTSRWCILVAGGDLRLNCRGRSLIAGTRLRLRRGGRILLR